MAYTQSLVGGATRTTVASSTSSVTLLAANIQRRQVIIFNNSTRNLFLTFGATSSATAFSIRLVTFGVFIDSEGYTGVISGIWSAVNGDAQVTEVS